MRRYCYETTSDLPPSQLYAAIADVARWPEWDDEIEGIEIAGEVETGSTFALKPRGRDAVKLRVETMAPPYRFADMAYLPLAQNYSEGAARQTRRFLAFARRQLVSNENVPQKPAAALQEQPLPNYVFC